jgi:hypothetical protein
VPARCLSFPFRVDASGVVATVEQNTDQDVEELIAVGVLTEPGERILAPTFGVADPAFVGFELSNLQRHLADFGPAVAVTAVEVARRGDDREELQINWRRVGGEP